MGAVTNLSQNDAGTVIDAIATGSVPGRSRTVRQKPLVGAYVALLLFMVIYCARPEDWVPGLLHVPLAKSAGVLALLAVVFSLRQIRQRLPREVLLLSLLIGQLFVASLMSPVWQGGAFQATLDFAKVSISCSGDRYSGKHVTAVAHAHFYPGNIPFGDRSGDRLERAPDTWAIAGNIRWELR